MQILHTALQLHQWRQQHKQVGFVPTMGALHKGHLSLVLRACTQNDATLVSIFVNPTQFNDSNDLARYPRTLDADVQLLQSTPCDAVFVPSVEEVYPTPDTRVFDFGQLDKVMEGSHRPGHFNGVAQVVSRLLEMAQPTRAYFGQKDFQQLAIVKALMQQLHYAVEIVPCPIVRESDGLAMSSRNTLLVPEQRAAAPLIFKTLSEAVNLSKTLNINELQQFVRQKINAHPLLQIEYFEVVNADTLQAVCSWEEAGSKQGCIAVHAGDIRLIDNVQLEGE
ncbi:pantothenate synthetase [Bacteroidia bacterium]|nr:pantothenate synthetase [Bacteroidia bacterium]